MHAHDFLINPELVKLAAQKVARLRKRAFVPGGDAAAGGGGAPPGGGGAPPMDPSMMGMDPAAMGGGAPPPPPPGGGDGGTHAKLDQIMMALQAGGGGAGAGAAGLKPKIDVNVEIMQMKNLLSKVVDALGIPVPTQDMVATPEKLTAMAQGQNAATGQAAPMPAGAIPPMGGMEGMPPAGVPGAAPPGGGGGGGEKGGSYRERGEAYGERGSAGLGETQNPAAAVYGLLAARRNGNGRAA